MAQGELNREALAMALMGIRQNADIALALLEVSGVPGQACPHSKPPIVKPGSTMGNAQWICPDCGTPVQPPEEVTP